MLNPPQTEEEAKQRTYGTFGLRMPYRSSKCAYEVLVEQTRLRQCDREKGFGPAGLYCKQHAKKIK